MQPDTQIMNTIRFDLTDDQLAEIVAAALNWQGVFRSWITDFDAAADLLSSLHDWRVFPAEPDNPFGRYACTVWLAKDWDMTDFNDNVARAMVQAWCFARSVEGGEMGQRLDAAVLEMAVNDDD